MPINESNWRRAAAELEKAKRDPNSNPERISKIEMNLNSFLESAPSSAFAEQPAGEQYGPPEAPVVPTQDRNAPRGSVGGYFYEPSVEEFRSAVQDPSVRENIGLTGSYRADNTAGRSYLESQSPDLAALAQTDVNKLGEQSDEYKKYADYAYNQAAQKDPSISRYSDLGITSNPFKKSMGAVIKYGPAAALGAEKTLTLGLGRGSVAQAMVSEPIEPGSRAARVGRANQSESQSQADLAAQKYVTEGAKTLESLSPAANTIGQIGAYAVPIAPANVAARELQGALGYAANNPFTKAGIGSLVGGTVSAGEGAAQDIAENPNISGEELLSNSVPRAVTGAIGGGVGDILAQGSNKTQHSFEESPRWSGIKNQKDVGGGTNLITGVQSSPAVRENITAAQSPRGFKHPRDIAAEKVAPQISESLDKQLTSEASKINKQIEDYTASPEGQELHSADPAVDRLLSMADKGTVSMPVSGATVSANRPAADTIRKNLQEFADFAHVSPEEAKSITQQHGGRILTDKQSNVLGLPSESGKVHVVVPAKFNAEALLKKEDQIARNLKYDTKEGGVDNPILQEMNQAFKEIRDKFKYKDPNAVSPPSPEPFAERRSPDRPTNEQWQAMQRPKGVNANTPISEIPKDAESSVGVGDTEKPAAFSEPVPVGEVRGNKRYQEPSVSEYGQMANGDNVDKSGNGYQRLVDTEDFAPGYRLRTNPNEISSLNKLAEETDAISGKSSGTPPEDYVPEFPKNESEQTWNGNPFPRDKSPFSPSHIGRNPHSDWAPNEDLYTANPPESIPAESYKSEQPSGTAPDNVIKLPTPSERVQSKIDADHEEFINNIKAEEESPNYPKPKEPWYPEGHIQSYDKQGRPLYANKDGGLTPFKPQRPKSEQPPKSLFPEVADQKGIADKTELAQANQTPDVGKVKEIVSKTDEAANGLTPEELDAIHSYTSRRGEKVGSEEWKSATKKLTVDKPTAGGALYHGTRLPQANIDEILKTGKVHFNKPTSTSYNDGIASAMAYSRGNRGEAVIFEIPEVDNGVSLASKKLGVAGTNNEKEILLNDKHFEVTGSKKNKDGDLVVSLKQTTPSQMEATLDDGTKVYGFSALRRKQHEALDKLNEAKKGAGAATKEGGHTRVLGYKSGGRPHADEALANEADKLGLRQQLEEVPATAEFPNLRARSWGGGGEGPMNALKDALGFRADALLGAIAGEPRNPYTALPNTPAGRIQQYLFRQGVPMRPLLEAKGGLAGARYGNEFADRNRKR